MLLGSPPRRHTAQRFCMPLAYNRKRPVFVSSRHEAGAGEETRESRRWFVSDLPALKARLPRWANMVYPPTKRGTYEVAALCKLPEGPAALGAAPERMPSVG